LGGNFNVKTEHDFETTVERLIEEGRRVLATEDDGDLLLNGPSNIL